MTSDRARQAPVTPLGTRLSGGTRRLAARTELVGRGLRIGGFVALAGLAAFGVVQGARALEQSDVLPVRSIAVRGAEDAPLSAARIDELRAYAAIDDGTPLLAIDTEAVAARVLEHPFVAAVNVRRVPPDGIEIVVAERKPAAVLVAETLYLVDRSGRVMKSARPGDGLDLPLITGATSAAPEALSQALAVIAAYEEAGSPAGTLSEVHVIEGVGFELVLAGHGSEPLRVRLGDSGIAEKLVRLDVIVARLAGEGRTASFIYLDDDRRPERAAVRLQPKAETPVVGGLKTTQRERG